MSILALLLAIAVIVWGIIVLRWGTTSLFAFLVLLAGTFFGPDFYHFNGPFQVSSERVLWVILLGFFVIHFRLGKTDPKPLSRVDWLLLIFCLLTGVSSQFGEPINVSSSPLARWLFFIVMPTGLYIVTRGSHMQPHLVRLITNSLIATGLYMASMAVFETRGLHSLVFPKYIVDPSIWEFFGRGRGPLLNPAGTGIVLTAALGASYTRFLYAQRLGRIGYGLATLVLLVGCYATLTRCVWMGAALTLAIITFIHLPKVARLWAMAAGLIFVVGLGGVIFQSILKIKRDKNLSAEEAKNSVELRPLLAVLALEMFKERPLTGHGFGRYLDSHKKFTESPEWDLPLANAKNFHQHNIVLSILVDCGFVVAAIYVSILAIWLTRAFRLFQNRDLDYTTREFGLTTASILIAYLVNGMFQDVLIVHMVNMYVWFFAALMMGLSIRNGYSPQHQVDAIPLSSFDPGRYSVRTQTT